MRKTFLPFSPPMIGEEEIVEVVDTLRSDWITTGPKVKQFEKEFAEFVGAPDALAVSSCTAALHLALLVLGIRPGDGVVTTPLTFCSGVNVIEHIGARPILADVEADTLNIDVTQARRSIERARRELGIQVKAIIPVHLHGHPCDLDSIFELAEEFDLAVVEDAAHCLPARYKGAMIGSHAATAHFPILTCFSFYATKNLTTAEGGMLVGKPEWLDKARVWALHGMDRDAWKRYGAQGSWFYEVVCPGYKYNMTDLQASLGLRQLRKLPLFHARRQQIATAYSDAFTGCNGLQVPAQRTEVEHAWHLYVLRLDADRLGFERNDVIAELQRLNIGSSVHFIPIHLHRYYREKYHYQPDDFPITLQQYQRMVSLPLSPRLTDVDVNDVIEAISAIVQRRPSPKPPAELARV